MNVNDCKSVFPNEPVHEISNVVCATSKASDQRSLIRAFASRLNII